MGRKCKLISIKQIKTFKFIANNEITCTLLGIINIHESNMKLKELNRKKLNFWLFSCKFNFVLFYTIHI